VVEKDENTSEEQVEETDRNGGKRKTTTIQRQQQTIYGDQEVPLVVQELLPAVEGILVVAEGGGNEAVKKQIEKTMMALFGLEAHKISIMKMEVTK
jgi:stage III sporulation protein AG